MAAGRGTRFGDATKEIPKGFINYKGKPMVIRSIETLISGGIEKIIIGTGYHHESYEALEATYPQIYCCFSPRFAQTNCLYTLWNCREKIGDEDFLLLDSDLVYEQKAIDALQTTPSNSAILATPVVKFQDSYFVEADADGRFVTWSKDKNSISPCGELVGIHKISNTFFKELCRRFERDFPSSETSSYEPYFQELSNDGFPIYIKVESNLRWYEIDDAADLKIAEEDINL